MNGNHRSVVRPQGQAVFRGDPETGSCSPLLRNAYKWTAPGVGRARVSGRDQSSGNPGPVRGKVSGKYNTKYFEDNGRKQEEAAAASADFVLPDLREVLLRKKLIAKMNDRQVKPPPPQAEKIRREIIEEIITSPADNRGAMSTLDTQVMGDKGVQELGRHNMQLNVSVQVNAAVPEESDKLVPVVAGAAVPPPVMDRHDLLMAFVWKTDMNMIYSNMCLEQFEWDFDAAYEAFQISKNIGNIPQEAFIW